MTSLPSYQQLALFFVRQVVAAIFLWHGVPKAIDWSAAFDKFVGFGLPGVLGPVTGIVEVIAAALLVVGLFHRVAVTAIVVIILGALVTVQVPAGITAGLERDVLILVATLLLLAHGPGALAITGPGRKATGAVTASGGRTVG